MYTTDSRGNSCLFWMISFGTASSKTDPSRTMRTAPTQGRIKVGAIDAAAALGAFLKQARMKTDENFPEAE
jgi:hypothetical protein